jgi:hypothetical protein
MGINKSYLISALTVLLEVGSDQKKQCERDFFAGTPQTVAIINFMAITIT